MRQKILQDYRKCFQENGSLFLCKQKPRQRWEISFSTFKLHPWNDQVAKKRDKQERKILDSQERAFWDVYRPPPGQVNTTEMDIKKMYKLSVIFGQEQALVGTEKTELSQLHRELTALQVLCSVLSPLATNLIGNTLLASNNGRISGKLIYLRNKLSIELLRAVCLQIHNLSKY